MSQGSGIFTVVSAESVLRLRAKAKASVNTLNEQLRTANKGWRSGTRLRKKKDARK